MVNQLPAPADASTDAKNRAWRTFLQGLLLDVVTTVAVAVAAQLSDIRWTKEYWLGVAALVGKSVVMAVVAYVMRKVAPPKTT